MSVYYFAITIVAILAIFAQQSDYDYDKNILTESYGVVHSKTTNLFLFFIGVTLVFVAGFRYYVGTDYHTYFHLFHYYADSFFTSLKSLDEPGIKLIYWGCRLFAKTAALPIFVCSLVTIGFSLRVLYKSTDQVMFATLLYLFLGCWHGSFNAVRQCLATMIVFCGYRHLKERQFFKYLMYVLIAALFHRSAIVMICLYFTVKLKIRLRNIILISIIGVLSSIYYSGIVGIILQDSEALTTGYAQKTVNILRTLVALSPAVYYLITLRNVEKDENSTFYLNILIFHAAIMVVASQSAYLARIGIYTAPFCAIAIPELHKLVPNNRTFTKTLIIFLYMVYFFYEIWSYDSLNNFQWVFSFV